jgi:Xylose isomerase-like TIM barrel
METRRKFIKDIGAIGAATVASVMPAFSAVSGMETESGRSKSLFRTAVINDEISQDFGRACEVAAKEFGMSWIELRGMWKKNILNLDATEVAEAQRILKKYDLRVTDIASPLFKTDWKGAPRSKFSTADDFHANFTFDQQDEVLESAIDMAKAFGTDRVRCFDFWRLDDQAPYRAAINEKLRQATEKAGKREITLLLENDSGLNTQTGAEAAKVLDAVKLPYLMLNWDPLHGSGDRSRSAPCAKNVMKTLHSSLPFISPFLPCFYSNVE